MTIRPVHWHEGMFLRPHHLQAAERHWLEHGNRNEKWDVHYNWGLRSIDLDLEALANHRLVVRSLKARLRDGTLISVPEDGILPNVDLKPALERESTVMAFLGVPVLRLGRANASNNGSSGARYSVDVQELEDENTGVNAQPIDVRLLNFTLLLSTQDRAGYEAVEIARIQKSDRPEASPELEPIYIPPVVACDAWPPLGGKLLSDIYNRIGSKLDLVVNQITSRGISIGSQAPGDLLLVRQLQALNEGFAVLRISAFAKGVHPLTTYLDLCRLVGQLAVFGPARRTPELPTYDHDNLGYCFAKVKEWLDLLLDLIVKPDYEEADFTGAALRMQVSLQPAWLEANKQMYVGVDTPLASGECVRLFTKAGEMNMKIGSADRVDKIFEAGQAGLTFTHAPVPPRVLPTGYVYFQVDRQSQQAEWQHVQATHSLAIRLNRDRIVGNIQDQKVLNIRLGAQTTTMQFKLFVVREKN